MTHPYAVVYFKDEHSYSEIPADWILSDETCWWPECKNIASLILRKAVPNENNGQWKKYKIEVVGFYASLEAARRKAIDSDCSSDDGNMGKGLRKKKRSTKIYSDTSEEDDYRERTPPPSLKTKVLRETPKINILENSFVENTSEESNKLAELASSASEDIGIDGNNTLVADIPKHLTQLELLEGKIDKLSIMMKKVLIYVKGTDDGLSQNEKIDKNMEINVDIILGKLPLQSVEGIMDLEATIKDDKDLRERFMNYLKNIGGRTTKEMVSRILAKLLKNYLGVQCSLLGKRNHFRFKDLKLMDVIITAVRQNFSSSSESEIELSVGEWLRLSKLRMSREK